MAMRENIRLIRTEIVSQSPCYKFLTLLAGREIKRSGCSHFRKQAVGKSTNILVDKIDRQELLQQEGCVIWITGLSGSVMNDSIQKVQQSCKIQTWSCYF
ncbi:uncharacterized protein LOC123200581 isoform X4 [Mangifera indica]|uniref:uncharacterized protein LOC123200581 isoform X4 n=2 Tax=Mangifera indica TaxID=29780 RepID=UPI001CF9B520|nr:uncharacterized protein LOC123200581 isoform X4 [Mangifera indica]